MKPERQVVVRFNIKSVDENSKALATKLLGRVRWGVASERNKLQTKDFSISIQRLDGTWDEFQLTKKRGKK